MTRATTAAMPSTPLPAGESIPVLGQGTWGMGERASRRTDEIAALRLGLDLGMTLVDTAEMYANGGAERVVGEAVAGRRDRVFIVSKVLPDNAARRRTVESCEGSLRRLGTDRIDLYLLHWLEESTPIDETVRAFEALMRDGKIRHWGVSNFDVSDMATLPTLAGGAQTDQVLYNLTRRGVEFDLLPWLGAHRVPVMAYSPVEQGRLLKRPALAEIARRHERTPAQIALAWVLGHSGVVAIPKASRLDHVRDNRAALEVRLTTDDLAALDRAFPKPAHKVPLEMI